MNKLMLKEECMSVSLQLSRLELQFLDLIRLSLNEKFNIGSYKILLSSCEVVVTIFSPQLELQTGVLANG